MGHFSVEFDAINATKSPGMERCCMLPSVKAFKKPLSLTYLVPFLLSQGMFDVKALLHPYGMFHQGCKRSSQRRTLLPSKVKI